MWTRLVEWSARVRAVFTAGVLDRELDEELEAHLVMLTDENLRRGMAPDDARRAAIVRLGNRESTKELHRRTRGLPVLETIGQDLRFTLRSLRRDPGFTTFTVLIVALGIGASATVFSVVNAVLLRPLPFPDADRLVWIANSGTDGVSGRTVPVFYFTDLRDQNRSFVDIAAYFAFYGVGDSKLTNAGEPQRLSGVPVSQNFFSVLGVVPQLGRTFSDDECRFNGPKAVLLSHRLWVARFASDPAIVGRKLTLNDAPVTVVGVLPTSFDFATVFAPGTLIDVYFPFPLTAESNRWGNTLAMVGRLKAGVTTASAQSEVDVLAPRIRRRDPDRVFHPRVSLLSEYVSGGVRLALVILACAVGVAMLIVCANLANLLLARTAARQKELAIRVALGAGRGRLIQQVLTESVVLSLAGALVGLALAAAGTRGIAHLSAFSIPLLDTVRLDAGALGFTVALAVLTGLVFGVVPAAHVPALGAHESLKDSTRGSTAGKRRTGIRDALVVSEIALACVLLVGAGLLIRSLVRVLDVNLGFQPERAAALRIDPGAEYTDRTQRNAYYDEALRRVRSIAGVGGAGVTDALPLGGNRSWGAMAKGHPYTRENPPPDAFVRVVSDGYFRAMGIAFRAGRDFTEHDRDSMALVIIVNETLARTLWPGENPIGRTMTADTERLVIGVVSDVRHLALEEASGCEMYLPIRQTDDYSSVDLVVRTRLPPAALASAVRTALAPLDPDVPANEFRTLQQLVDRAVSPRRFVVFLLGAFSLFAVLLASLGIYAVVSYAVGQRTQEIGIRMALGASERDVQAGVILQTLRLAAVGIVLGLAASWMFAFALRGLLFGVATTDPPTFAAMVAILTAVAVIAGYLPARRASRIDPSVALRTD